MAAPEACSDYRVDVTATRFGDCKCGWPKAAHAAGTVKASPKAGVAFQKSAFTPKPAGGDVFVPMPKIPGMAAPPPVPKKKPVEVSDPAPAAPPPKLRVRASQRRSSRRP